MGTRGLTIVQKDGKYKVAQYGQWDHCPKGQGLTVLNFLKSDKVDKLKANLDKCVFLPEERFEEVYNQVRKGEKNGLISWEEQEEYDKILPYVSRDIGADILELIADAEDTVELRNSISFISDSLFCEMAFLIDFDTNTFEIYEGFNQEPLAVGDRFACMPVYEPEHRQEIYYPCRLVMGYSLDDLPSTELFLDDFGCDMDDEIVLRIGKYRLVHHEEYEEIDEKDEHGYAVYKLVKESYYIQERKDKWITINIYKTEEVGMEALRRYAEVRTL